MIKDSRNPFLCFVTPDIGEDSAKWLRMAKEAILGGASVLQIRDKTSSAKMIISSALQLQPFLKERKVPLIINDHVEIAKIIQADGVHLGQLDRTVAEARSILGPEAIIGLSLENLTQLSRVEGADYVAASPLFPTLTKKDVALPWGLEGLAALRKATSLPIVAIGGIQPCHVPDILEAGARGVAVISAIATASCPRQAAKEFVMQMELMLYN